MVFHTTLTPLAVDFTSRLFLMFVIVKLTQCFGPLFGGVKVEGLGLMFEALYRLAIVGLVFIALTVLSVLGFGGYWLYRALT